MNITWLGQSTFVVSSSSGVTVLMDPAGPGTGYTPAPVPGVDLVTISHEHSDHNNTSLAAGQPQVIHGLAGNDWAKIDQVVKGVRVRAVGTYHDDTNGSQRGKNAVFILETDGLRLAHMGDLGHPLSEEQAKAIGDVDIVLIPVGGFYTIDGPTAARVLQQLSPRPKVVIPMHYRTPDLNASLAGRLGPVEDFTDALGGIASVVSAGHSISVRRDTLPSECTAMVMAYR